VIVNNAGQVNIAADGGSKERSGVLGVVQVGEGFKFATGASRQPIGVLCLKKQFCK
jgi:hypothetical protein